MSRSPDQLILLPDIDSGGEKEDGVTQEQIEAALGEVDISGVRVEKQVFGFTFRPESLAQTPSDSWVLVPGMGLETVPYMSILAASMAQAGMPSCQVVLNHLPGSLDDMLTGINQAVYHWRQEFSGTKINIIGHSFGAYSALISAGRLGEGRFLNRLVLVAPGPVDFMTIPPLKEKLNLAKLILDPSGSQALPQFFNGRMEGDSHTVIGWVTAAYQGRGFERGYLRYLVGAGVAGLGERRRLTDPPWSDLIIVRAGQDRVISPAEINTYRNIKSHEVVLPDAHHMIPANARFSKRLLRLFLNLTNRTDKGAPGANF